MISKLQLDLTTKSDLKSGSYLGPLFQGVLMELISPEYADELHVSSLHPYSQHICKAPNGLIWTVNTLDTTARSEVISALSDINITSLKLRNKDAEFHIAGKKA